MGSHTFIAEYIWVDGSGNFRSKSRVCLQDDFEGDDRMEVENYPIWNYDGSSTGDAKTVEESGITECVLKPMKVFKDVFRRSEVDVIVYCQAFYLDNEEYDGNIAEVEFDTEEFESYVKSLKLHPVNEDLNLAMTEFSSDEYVEHDPMFGFEQEFFMINPETNMPFGMVKGGGRKNSCWFTRGLVTTLRHLFGSAGSYSGVEGPQGPYYCGVGYQRAILHRFLDDCMEKALDMGLSITGFNYEVAPGQAEFQVCDYGINACHQLVMLRYLLVANGESHGIKISFNNCVIPGGKYNHSGCHTNFSTEKMRTRDTEENKELIGLEYIKDVINNFDTNYIARKSDFEAVFGDGVTKRLGGDLETSSWDQFTWGIGTRCTSIRIPISVARNGYGYLEDRRPGANVNPYAIANWLMEQVITYEKLPSEEEEGEEMEEVDELKSCNTDKCTTQCVDVDSVMEEHQNTTSESEGEIINHTEVVKATKSRGFFSMFGF